MTVNWNPLVNTKFSLEEPVTLKEGTVRELQFDSGKIRTYLKNSYVPRVFPSLNLLLNNKYLLENDKTEFEEFEEWFNVSLRFGIFTFLMKKLGFRDKWDTEIPEMGVYKFLGTPEYDRLSGTVLATFGLEEEMVVPEVKYTFLASNSSKVLLTSGRYYIAVD